MTGGAFTLTGGFQAGVPQAAGRVGGRRTLRRGPQLFGRRPGAGRGHERATADDRAARWGDRAVESPRRENGRL